MGTHNSGTEISPQQREQVLPFLTDRSAYPEGYAKLRIDAAFRGVQNSKKYEKVVRTKSLHDRGVRIIMRCA